MFKHAVDSMMMSSYNIKVAAEIFVPSTVYIGYCAARPELIRADHERLFFSSYCTYEELQTSNPSSLSIVSFISESL